MAKLILVKHSLPEIERGVAASQWRLGERGRLRCAVLAQALEAYRPAVIISSMEPKADETARLVAQAWNQAHTPLEGLHEHQRETVGWLDREAFELAVKRLFESPKALVFGEETARQAERRFAQAVAAAVARTAVPGQNMIVVAHGTVIALHVAALAGIDGYELWRRLALPSFVVLAGPGGPLEGVVDRLEARDGA